MNKLSEWKLAQKIQDSKHKGVIIGLAIAFLIIAIVVITIVKIRLLKKGFACLQCDIDDMDDFIDEDDCDENGCCYTSEKDFV
ncbi:MAG: hypothetical protein FWB91_07585 [Defluviitaleaceae bacterium]|nr:hypothetical protein [Defluviitaleaceae bacterium]